MNNEVIGGSRCWLFLFCSVLLVGCVDDAGQVEADHTAAPPLRVFAVNAPLAWMAEQIGGEGVVVEMPVADGVDPAHWQPDAEQILAWQAADLILLNGAGYAGWVRYASLPLERVVDTSASFSERLMPLEQSAAIHSHGPEGDHSHGAYAATVWLDLELAAEQATVVFEALRTRRPEQVERFDARHRKLQRYLAALHDEADTSLGGLRGRTIVYSHPVYSYFSRAYRLPGISMHWEPEQMPGETEWAQLRQHLDGSDAALMIWELAPLAQIERRLEQMGVEVVVWALGAGQPWREFGSVMEQNIGDLPPN